MAKESGLAVTTLSVDEGGANTLRAIINDVTDFAFAISTVQLPWTGVDKSAMERGIGLADVAISLNGIFNDADTTGSHTVLKDAPTTIFAGEVGRTISLVHSGQTLNNECLFQSYTLTRGTDGSLVFAAPANLSGGTVPAWS